MSRVSVIGSGFSGLAASCFLAKQGVDVTILEKNETLGGRARVIHQSGFKFDMGPSWYWMPDIFEHFFEQFGKVPSDYYQLVKLDPGFQMIFSKDDVVAVPASLEGIYDLFESIEKGSAVKLRRFLAEGAFKYKIGMSELVYKPSFSLMEFASLKVISGATRMHMFSSVRSYVRQFFKDERLIALMEFPVLFLGAMADKIPALYSLMNYAALTMGTWYPMGGMTRIVEAMEDLATSLGVKFETGCNVEKIVTSNGSVKKLQTSGGAFLCDGVVSSADYHHTEQKLLDEKDRNYNEDYWSGRTFAPSCLIYYLGVNKKLKKLIHHNLFFDASIDAHAKEIYVDPKWPENPLFYVCCPSVTDPTVAPEGMENLFILIPVATGLEDTEEIRESYYASVMKRLEDYCGEAVVPNVIYKKTYCINDFVKDYNAYKGNGYGLANTLRQTAILKPSLRNKKVENMFYAGQLTVPGPGVPPSLISGQIAAEQMLKYLKQ